MLKLLNVLLFLYYIAFLGYYDMNEIGKHLNSGTKKSVPHGSVVGIL